MYTNTELLWNWWEEGRREREHERVLGLVREWDNGADALEQTDEEAEAVARATLDELDERMAADRARRADVVARQYDEDRAITRLRLLRKESDAAFFKHAMDLQGSAARRTTAERRLAECRDAASELRKEVGEPDDVVDQYGYFPPERRSRHLGEHMRCWRYPTLRKWVKTERRRFSTLLAMPAPAPEAMCSECQAPATWHEYDLSLRLFLPRPEPGSQDEKLAQLMPSWWERCPACTAYNIEHRWGGPDVLPDFGGEQWQAMLPPLLRAIFAPNPVKKKPAKPRPKPLATVPPGPIGQVTAKLQKLQAEYPDAEVRQGTRGRWELWPAPNAASNQ